jgi:hypothetical protein
VKRGLNGEAKKNLSFTKKIKSSLSEQGVKKRDMSPEDLDSPHEKAEEKVIESLDQGVEKLKALHTPSHKRAIKKEEIKKKSSMSDDVQESIVKKYPGPLTAHFLILDEGFLTYALNNARDFNTDMIVWSGLVDEYAPTYAKQVEQIFRKAQLMMIRYLEEVAADLPDPHEVERLSNELSKLDSEYFDLSDALEKEFEENWKKKHPTLTTRK